MADKLLYFGRRYDPISPMGDVMANVVETINHAAKNGEIRGASMKTNFIGTIELAILVSKPEVGQTNG